MRFQRREVSLPPIPSLSDCVLILVAVSAAGWCFEMVGRFLVFRDIADRGFLTLPLCPIYGTCVLLLGLTLGSPAAPSPLLRRLWGKEKEPPSRVRLLLVTLSYFLAATAMATLLELGVGLIFLRLGCPLWDYSGRVGNLWGVICPSFSLLWGALLTPLMALCWVPLRRLAARLPRRIKSPLAWGLFLLLLGDFCLNCVSLLLRGERILLP